MNKELTIIKNEVIDYNSPDVIKTLMETVAQGLNNSEFKLFAEHCKGTGLNPFKKEVWAIKAGGRLQIMTGNQGFHAIANSHLQYDGMETGFVGKEGEYLPMTYPKPDFIGAWAKVYRKDRKIPLEAVAMLSEYDKGQSNWKTMRRIMIVKCAESLALRKAFPQELNGLYTQEEMPPLEAKPLLEAKKIDEIFKGDDIPDFNAEEGVKYDLTNAFEGVVEPETSKKLDYLKSQGGVEIEPYLWSFPVRVKALEKYEFR